jgi:hypothetical protein
VVRRKRKLKKVSTSKKSTTSKKRKVVIEEDEDEDEEEDEDVLDEDDLDDGVDVDAADQVSNFTSFLSIIHHSLLSEYNEHISLNNLKSHEPGWIFTKLFTQIRKNFCNCRP